VEIAVRPGFWSRRSLRFEGVTLVCALVAVIGEICRMSTTMRRRSMVSLRSALLRKIVLMTDSSYSRRLAGVSGTIVIVLGAVTR